MLDVFRNEPLRTRLYALAVLVNGYLLGKDIIDATDATFYGGVAAIVLCVETARAKVVPTRKVDPFNVGNGKRPKRGIDPAPEQE